VVREVWRDVVNTLFLQVFFSHQFGKSKSMSTVTTEEDPVLLDVLPEHAGNIFHVTNGHRIYPGFAPVEDYVQSASSQSVVRFVPGYKSTIPV